MSMSIDSIIPRQNDVLFGKGTAINTHPGNKHFRSVVESFKPKFTKTERTLKRTVAAEVVGEIHTLGGRFLMEDPNGIAVGTSAGSELYDIHPCILSKAWIHVEHDKIIGKVMHRLREKIQPLKSNEKTKHEKKKQAKPQQPDTPSSKKTEARPEPSVISGSSSTAEQNVYSELYTSTKEAEMSTSNNVLAHRKDDELDSFLEKILKTEMKGGSEQSPKAGQEEDLKLEPSSNKSFDKFDDASVSSNAQSEFSFDLSKPLDYQNIGLHHERLTNGAPSTHETIEVHERTDIDSQVDTFLLDFNAAHHERTNLDTRSDSFLLDSNAAHNDEMDTLEQVHEETMLQWIQKARANVNFEPETPGQTSEETLAYIKSALPVALKLTESLVEAEKDEKLAGGVNPIPLTSIAAANVLIRSKELDNLENTFEVDPFERKSTEEVIDYVFITSCVGDDSVAGGAMSRLFSLGIVFYKLFTGEDPPMEEGQEACANYLSVSSINLNDEIHLDDVPRKKRSDGGFRYSRCIADLKCMQLPYSIHALLGNLLECGRGDPCGDNAYPSLTELQMDLELMISEPSRFLYDIPTNPLPGLSICNKLYGREEEIAKLEASYKQHINGNSGGVILKGKAGVGKSMLAAHIQEISSKFNGYFLAAKFDQNKDVYPMATIGSLFNSLIELFVQDSTPDQLNVVGKSLQSALGVQATLLASILPSLSKLMPLAANHIGHAEGENSSMSIRFLFTEILRIVSRHSKRICLLFEDLQWADPVSMLIIRSMISSNEESKLVYFGCSYRDDEVIGNNQFNQWLGSISTSLENIKLGNMTIDGVNLLVSDALHLSPRVTRPLSSVLHHKAGGGNPLFVKQLLQQLFHKGYVFVNLDHPRWDWSLDKIVDLQVSDDVVALLIEEMHRLHHDLQYGLEIASCIGASVKYSILNILSDDLGLNLQDTLQQVARRGFLKTSGESFCFTHDKIEQAAYRLMTAEQRRDNHMRFGLAICSHTLNTSESDETFFTAINQINKGGANALPKRSQRAMIAALNLKAGKRAAARMDFNTAFKLYQHGISFLDKDHWSGDDYELSIDLFDAVSEAASYTNNESAVTFYTSQLFTHARCPDDKLNCMFAVTRTLVTRVRIKEAIENAFKLLTMLGEPLPRRLGDASLSADMEHMNKILQNTPNETILRMEERPNQKRYTTLMLVLRLLAHSFHYVAQDCIGSVSLRMVQLTMDPSNGGMSQLSAKGFAFYGQILVSLGKLDLGVRLGELALELVDKRGYFAFQSTVVCVVYQSIFWLSKPLREIADAHMTGYRSGQQSGNVLSSGINLFYCLSTRFTAGHCLTQLREKYREVSLKALRQKNAVTVNHSLLWHSLVCALNEGLHLIDQDTIDDLPGPKKILSTTNEKDENRLHQIYCTTITWNFLFRLFNDGTQENLGFLSDMILAKKFHYRPWHLFGFFFEGLTFYHYARKASNEESVVWNAKGDFVLAKMTTWNDHYSPTFQNKMDLLKAEKLSISGRFDEAEALYTSSIRSANVNGFIHEEAVASELAAVHYFERGDKTNSYSYYMHSIECFKKWEAYGVATRVESSMQCLLGPHMLQLDGPIDDSIFDIEEGESRKRER